MNPPPAPPSAVVSIIHYEDFFHSGTNPSLGPAFTGWSLLATLLRVWSRCEHICHTHISCPSSAVYTSAKPLQNGLSVYGAATPRFIPKSPSPKERILFKWLSAICMMCVINILESPDGIILERLYLHKNCKTNVLLSYYLLKYFPWIFSSFLPYCTCTNKSF